MQHTEENYLPNSETKKSGGYKISLQQALSFKNTRWAVSLHSCKYLGEMSGVLLAIKIHM